MKQVLIYLVEFLKEQHGMSMSEMSKVLGKSRNFIREAITRGYENEEKYKSLIADLDYQFFVSGDYADFIKFMEKKHQEELYKTEIAGDKIVDHLHERVELATKKNKELEHQVTILKRSIDIHGVENEKLKVSLASSKNELNKLKNEAVLQESMMLEQDLEIRKYKKISDNKCKEITSLNKSIEALAKAGHSTGDLLNKEKKHNRILLSMLLLFCAIDLIMAFLRYM
ncbi:MAG: hypothetical protein [Caudoviricetes sp.]|nr:MAG: hypothetical protein [Caudoviricetes sp.]